MARELISKKTRMEFREYLVGWTLREISAEFDSADVPFAADYDPQIGGQRRTHVERYYRAVDWTKWTDVQKVLIAYGNILTRLAGLSEGGDQYAPKNFASLRNWIERDGYKYQEGQLVPLARHQMLDGVAAASPHFTAPELHRQIERMKASVDGDPGLAIGTAKELIESTCKTILAERNIKYADDADVAALLKEVRKVLGLIPEAIPNSAKGVEIIRRLLGSLGSVAQSLAELRNLYGTGHGKHGSARGLGSRHAKLAVGAAATLAVFLFETHNERDG